METPETKQVKNRQYYIYFIDYIYICEHIS